MAKLWKVWAVLIALLGAAVTEAHAAESLTGEYRIKGTQGDIVLTLREDGQGGATGTLKGGGLSLIFLGVRDEENGIVGRASTEAGEFASYFAAEKKEGQLLLNLIEANAEGEPDYATAKRIPFPAGAPATVPDANVATPDNSGVAGASFGGTFKGDGLTLESRAQGNDYTGSLILGGQRMPFTGTATNGVLHGAFEVQGERYDFQAKWQGTTLLLSSDDANYKLHKENAASNPLAKPKASNNPLNKPKTQPATPAKTTGAVPKPAAKPAVQPAAKPAGAPAGGAAWQVFKHPTGLSLRYPPKWKALDLQGVLQLTPPDVKQIGGGPAEVFLVLANSAGPIRSGDDPQLEQSMEQQAAQYLPGFTRVGATQAIKAGTEPGILMTWEGASQGTAMRAQVYATVLKNYGIAFLAISAKDQIKAARDADIRQIFASLAAGAGEKDKQVVGKWFLYSYKGSGGYGRESKSYITLLPDGTALWGQQNESAFSANTGSFASQGNSGDRGTWSAANGQLMVSWGDGTTGAWQYRVGGSSGGNRRLFLTKNGKTDEWMEVQ